MRFPDRHKLELGFTLLQLRFRTAELMQGKVEERVLIARLSGVFLQGVITSAARVALRLA